MAIVGDTRYVPLSKAKATLPKIVEELQRPTVLVRHSEPVAALVSIEKYNEYLALENLMRHPEVFVRFRLLAKEAAETPIKSLRTMQDLEALHKKLLKPQEPSAAPKRATRR